MSINNSMAYVAQRNYVQPMAFIISLMVMIGVGLSLFAIGANKGSGGWNLSASNGMIDGSMSFTLLRVIFIIFLLRFCHLASMKFTILPSQSVHPVFIFSMPLSVRYAFMIFLFLCEICIVSAGVRAGTNLTPSKMPVFITSSQAKLFDWFCLPALRTSLIHVNSTKAKCLLLHGSSMKQKAEYSLSQFRLLDPSEIYLRDYITKGELL